MKDLRISSVLILLTALAALAGCESGPVAERPLFRESPRSLDARLPEFQAARAALPDRVIDIARANIGQPYQIYLLGESPFETIDKQPVYSLKKSDCVVFVEHTLAMAMSDTFPDFLRALQRIRYHDGVIGVRTRNHFTESDWNVNNRWLVQEITSEIGCGQIKQYKQVVNRKAFFKKRYKIDVDVPKESDTENYVPYENIDEVKSQLRTGDVVNIVKGTSATSAWAHHMGFVAVMPDGAVHIIHSTVPRVKEEPIDAYIARNTRDNAKNDAKGKPRHRGFKFFRLMDDPMANLKAIDGAEAPKVTIPAQSRISFEAYVERAMKR